MSRTVLDFSALSCVLDYPATNLLAIYPGRPQTKCCVHVVSVVFFQLAATIISNLVVDINCIVEQLHFPDYLDIFGGCGLCP